MTEKNDIKIAGSGSIGEGSYAHVRIAGSGKANGSIQADSVHISGSGHFMDMKAGEFHVSGSANIDGELSCSQAHISGSIKITGNAEAEELRVSGSGHVRGNLKAKSISVSGSVTCAKDIECENMHINGGAQIAGLLNAETLRISLGGSCDINEIGGETIRVEQGNFADSFIRRMFGSRKLYRLRCNSIEGTQIHLENTDCRVVRGRDIEIGPGSKIGLVEYTESLSKADDAVIEKSVKI